jgi:hypothetical protein
VSRQAGIFGICILCVVLACGDPAEPPNPTGSLDVSVTTTGSENDPVGVAILVDDLQRKSLPGAGHAVITGLEPGNHAVEIDSLPPTCIVTADNPRSVEIQAGATTSVTFEVSCTPYSPTGGIRVITTTTGSSLDPNGYGVWVDGKLAGAVGINDTLDVSGLAAGDHLVELRDVASACTTTSLTVAVTPPNTTDVTLSVTCTTPPPGAATIAIFVTTQVVSVPLPAHYLVVLDGGQSKTIPPNGSTSFTTVPGTHSVLLRSPSYCLVGGFTGAPNPQIVTVAAGAEKTVRFAVLCIP